MKDKSIFSLQCRHAVLWGSSNHLCPTSQELGNRIHSSASIPYEQGVGARKGQGREGAGKSFFSSPSSFYFPLLSSQVPSRQTEQRPILPYECRSANAGAGGAAGQDRRRVGGEEGGLASERASERACENGDESGAQLASPPTYFPLTGTAALALKLALSESERSGRKTEAADGRARERGKCGGKGKGHGRRRRQDGRLCKALRQWVTCRNKKAEMQDGEYKIRRFTAVSAILILTKG